MLKNMGGKDSRAAFFRKRIGNRLNIVDDIHSVNCTDIHPDEALLLVMSTTEVYLYSEGILLE
jgi:hypothetical protein